MERRKKIMNNIMDNIKNWMPLPEDTWK